MEDIQVIMEQIGPLILFGYPLSASLEPECGSEIADGRRLGYIEYRDSNYEPGPGAEYSGTPLSGALDSAGISDAC